MPNTPSTQGEPKYRTGRRVLAFFVHAGRVLLTSLSHNLGLKLLSLVLSLLLWSYVITANPDITRDKILSGVDVSITGQAVLSSRNLALRTDVSAVLGNVRARVATSQSTFGLVTDDNVRAELDLSSIRTIGHQRVTLKGTSVYGDVVQLWPEYLEVEVEELVQRYVPVGTDLMGTDEEHYWYATRTNPVQITVSGPESIVSTVSVADVSMDATDVTSSIVRAEQLTLRNSQGEAITHPLTKSSSSAMIYLDVYPVKTVPIATHMEEVLTGSVPVGYEITSATVSPDTVLIAADRTLLDTIDELSFNKIDVTGKTAAFTRTVNLPKLNGLKYASTDQVAVSVTISEVDTTRTFSEIPVRYLSTDGVIRPISDTIHVDVAISGPYTRMEDIEQEDICATIDLTGLEAGEYELPVYAYVEGQPELRCLATPKSVTIQLP